MNTSFNLMYRDEDNYKYSKKVVLSGEITDEQVAAIRDKMEEGYFIIAEQIGLPTPSEEMAERFDFPNESDHVWTTVLAFEDGFPTASDLLTKDDVTMHEISINQLVDAILAVESWDEAAEIRRLDM